MDRRKITAAVVEEADRLLTFGLDYATIAARLGISEYVVRVIATDALRKGRKQPRQRFDRRVLNPQRAVDAATIRMIQRMLAVGILNRSEIAREAGVARSLVERVAKGKRKAIDTARPILNHGERFLRQPVRCPGCRALVSIIPCRLCKARRKKIPLDVGASFL